MLKTTGLRKRSDVSLKMKVNFHGWGCYGRQIASSENWFSRLPGFLPAARSLLLSSDSRFAKSETCRSQTRNVECVLPVLGGFYFPVTDFPGTLRKQLYLQ